MLANIICRLPCFYFDVDQMFSSLLIFMFFLVYNICINSMAKETHTQIQTRILMQFPTEVRDLQPAAGFSFPFPLCCVSSLFPNFGTCDKLQTLICILSAPPELPICSRAISVPFLSCPALFVPAAPQELTLEQLLSVPTSGVTFPFPLLHHY